MLVLVLLLLLRSPLLNVPIETIGNRVANFCGEYRAAHSSQTERALYCGRVRGDCGLNEKRGWRKVEDIGTL